MNEQMNELSDHRTIGIFYIPGKQSILCVVLQKFKKRLYNPEPYPLHQQSTDLGTLVVSILLHTYSHKIT